MGCNWSGPESNPFITREIERPMFHSHAWAKTAGLGSISRRGVGFFLTTEVSLV